MTHNPKGTLDISDGIAEKFPNPSSRSNFGLNKAHYTKVTGPLFPALPTVADIKQQELADCYLLAGVMAILARQGGAETIEGTMFDRGTDVVVRLYDKDSRARYVAIERSIRKNAEKHNGGAIWASLLEKAYAAATFVEEGKKYSEGGRAAKADAKTVAGWAKLSFGSSTEAMRVLLGTKGNESAIHDGLLGGASTDVSRFSQLFSVEVASKMHDSVRANLRDSIFGGDGDKLHRFLQWRTDHVQHSWKTLQDAYGTVTTDANPDAAAVPRKVMRLEAFSDFLTKHGLPTDIAAIIVNFAESKQLMPGKRGTGQYTVAQITLFDRIKRAIAENRPVTLASQASVGTSISATGKSGGEAIVKGLAASHAYAVLSVREETAAPKRKWVRVRNPWGSTGRSYVPSPKGGTNALKAVETTDAEFELELADLTKRFDKVHIAGVVI